MVVWAARLPTIKLDGLHVPSLKGNNMSDTNNNPAPAPAPAPGQELDLSEIEARLNSDWGGLNTAFVRHDADRVIALLEDGAALIQEVRRLREWKANLLAWAQERTEVLRYHGDDYFIGSHTMKEVVDYIETDGEGWN
jgi:hypothetical protein